MLFFPYRADLEQWRFPLVTLLICAVSAIVLANQYNQKSSLQWQAVQSCYLNADSERDTALQYLAERLDMPAQRLCTHMLVAAHASERPQAVIRGWAYASNGPLGEAERRQRAYIDSVLQRSYAGFSIDAPQPLTERLWFDPAPGKVSALSMITSVFAHANVMHLLINLFFFFAFAATVEMVVGSLSMLATVVLLALLSNGFYAMMSLFEGGYPPTLGLSGVVFGMMGMFACFLPQIRVKCFVWLLVFYRRLVIPAWLLVVAYVSWNLYSWWQLGNHAGVNFLVHISGALFGYLLAALVFRNSLQAYSQTTIARNMQHKYLFVRD